MPLAFPYISDTGNVVPESCIFSFGMNISSFLCESTMPSLFATHRFGSRVAIMNTPRNVLPDAVAVYLRYRELIHFRAMSPDCRISLKWNRFGFWLGMLSALGLCVVANFQVGKVRVPHYIGAMCCFVGGSAYFALQVGLFVESSFGSVQSLIA